MNNFIKINNNTIINPKKIIKLEIIESEEYIINIYLPNSTETLKFNYIEDLNRFLNMH